MKTFIELQKQGFLATPEKGMKCRFLGKVYFLLANFVGKVYFCS